VPAAGGRNSGCGFMPRSLSTKDMKVLHIFR
jgi:hypothetical protein